MPVEIINRVLKQIEFNDKFVLSDVSYMYTKNNSTWKTLAACGIAVFIIGSEIDIAGEMSAHSFQVNDARGTYYPYSGSCPTVFTSDGKNEFYESETFAGSIFRNAERTSYDILKYLKPVDGKLKLKLVNERPETDYVNELKVIAVDVMKNIKIIPDINGNLITISDSLPPKSCSEFSGNNKLGDILKNDDKYWESNLNVKDFSKENDLNDGLMLEFNKPKGAKQAKLVIGAINTRLLNFAFDELQKLKGKELLHWYYDLDNNPKERMKFFNFLLRSAFLNIKIMNNGEWKSAQQMIYTGPDIEKEQVAVLDISHISGNYLKVKIESTTGLWKINNIYIDYSKEIEYYSKELSPEKSIDIFGNDITELISKSDNKYYTTINNQNASVVFNDIPLKNDLNRIYILKTGGYYLQWFPPMENEPSKLFNRILEDPLFGCKMYLPLWRENKNK